MKINKDEKNTNKHVDDQLDLMNDENIAFVTRFTEDSVPIAMTQKLTSGEIKTFLTWRIQYRSATDPNLDFISSGV